MTAKPGDIIVTESNLLRDVHVVLRVVKIGKVMWDVQKVERSFDLTEDKIDFGTPEKRKIGKYKIYRGSDVKALYDAVRGCRDTLRRAENEVRDAYHASIAALPGLEKPE